jgi:putative FmdB family regulatory protein
MPLYEYACEACGERFEQLVGQPAGIDPKELACPRCGSRELRKLVSEYAFNRQMTGRQRRRLEAKRGIDRGGAKDRFKAGQAARRQAGKGRS